MLRELTRMPQIPLLGLLCALGSATLGDGASAWAETYRVLSARSGQFTGEVLVGKAPTRVRYDEAIQRLADGDELIFTEDGRDISFKLGENLGNGGSTRVFDLGSGRILRVPRDLEVQPLTRSFLLSQGYLKHFMRQLVQVDPERSSRTDQFSVVKREKIEFTLQDLLRTTEEDNPARIRSGLSPLPVHPISQVADKSKYYEALVRFSKDAALLRQIPDFNSSQLGWNGHDWILLDFGLADSMDLPVVSYDPRGRYVMDGLFNSTLIPEDIRAKMKQASVDARRSARDALPHPGMGGCAALFAHPLLSKPVLKKVLLGL